MKSIAHYCQKCRAANDFGQELCVRCGTRLMLVTEPAVSRFEGHGLTGSQEEYLLERISILENGLTRMVDRLQQSLDLFLKQARNTYLDHALVETLIELLCESGALNASRLHRLWRERCQKFDAEQEIGSQREERRTQIIRGYRGIEKSTFEKLVNQGFKELRQDETVGGIRTLERAASLAPTNVPLMSFLGEHFFRAGQTVLARDYLINAFAAAPDDFRLCLLLGLACADEGDIERSRALLSAAARHGEKTFAVHYGLGRLLVAERKWKEALAEFKLALAARPSPEAHYVLGCIYYQLDRQRLAARHLRQAIEMDGEFAAAFYMLGLVYLRTDELEQAREAFKSACTADESVARYRSALRGTLRADETPRLPPLFASSKLAKKRLVTSGDERLAEFLRADALSTAASRNGQR
jgi:Flp pilus assembly protein TadD